MNHTFRVIWNPDTQGYIAAPETAKGRGKSTAKALAPAAMVLAASVMLPVWAQTPLASALPTGASVQAGQVQIVQTANAMTVTQGTAKAIIDWSSFDIGKDASVTFQQPSRTAVALNRVAAGDASQIHGQLQANGNVWLLNPQGVVFGSTGRVDVGGLVASTLEVRDQDFLDGTYRFSRNGAQGRILNQGHITTQEGGEVALLAPQVHNDGVIQAHMGTVALAAGDQISLEAGANGLLNIQVDPATLSTLIENQQVIVADGGQVIMTGKAADALAASVVANTGTIQSNRLQERDGKILLVADTQYGDTQAAGVLQAARVQTSGAVVHLDAGLQVDTAGGQWQIDTVNFTIDANPAAAIQHALGSGDVAVTTAAVASSTGSPVGDVQVNADITYTKNKLTLNAYNDINLNAVLEVNGGGTLALNYGDAHRNTHAVANSGSNLNAGFAADGGFAGAVNFAQSGTGLLAINGVDYTVIHDMAALQAIHSNPHGAYALGSDIHAAEFWGFSPIHNFGGSLDGLGHTIQGLQISNYVDNTGLFATTNHAVLRNVGLQGGNVYVSSGNNVGALVGRANQTSISHVFTTASVQNAANSWGWFTGGLVGLSENSSISHSYASGAISGNWFTGGLVGRSVNSTVSQSYASGDVTGRSGGMGGLVGSSIGGSKIDNSYATGDVYGYGSVGGLVGHMSSDAQISYSFATGRVTHDPNGAGAGGLIGEVEGGINPHITEAFYASTAEDGSSNGNTAGGGGIAKTWAQLADPNTLAAWDSQIWGKASVLGTAVEGYATGSHLMLKGVSRAQDTQYQTLFDGGWGTADSAYGISNWQHLDHIREVLGSGYLYQLQGNLDRTSAGYAALASAVANDGAGWNPLGSVSRAFTGSFNGQGYTISDVQIQRPLQDYVGLFGLTHKASIQNLGVEHANIQGRNFVGALLGSNWDGAVNHVFATGQVSGMHAVGGLMGENVAYGFGRVASVANAYANVQVAGHGQGIGQGVGLGIGRGVGGLVGQNVGDAGGIASMTEAYAQGSVQGDSQVGGLLGYHRGSSYGQAKAIHTYATGEVSGTGQHVGGLMGLAEHESSVSASFWDTATTLQTAGIGSGNAQGITGVSTAQLQQLATFADAGWDIDDVGGSAKVWRIYEGYTAPLLRSFLQTAEVSVYGGGGDLGRKTYDGSQASIALGSPDYSLPQGVALQGTGLRYLSSSANAGAYNTADGSLQLQGLYSGQQGYDIAYVGAQDAVYRIDKAPLTVSGTNVAGREYNGSTDVRSETTLGSLRAGSVFGQDQVHVEMVDASLDSKNAGSRTATVTYALRGGDADNYTVAESTHSGVQIAPKVLTVRGITADAKTYDGTTAAVVHADHVVLDELVEGDQLNVAATGQFSDKNAGIGQTVYLSSRYGGADVGNYRILDQASTAADIGRQALTITADTANKIQGDALSWHGQDGFTVGQGLVGLERIEGVTLRSAGAQALALPGVYRILVSDAVGVDGFDARNYDIRYETGALTVQQKAPEGASLWRAQGRVVDAAGQGVAQARNVAVPGPMPKASSLKFLSMAPHFIRRDGEQ